METRFISTKTICQQYGVDGKPLHPNTVYQWRIKKDFPQPVRRGVYCKAAVEQWASENLH